MNLTFRNIALPEGEPPTRLRLAERGGSPRLFLAQGSALFEAQLPAEGSARIPMLTAAGQVGSGSWDARPFGTESGSAGVLFVRAESAVNWVMFRFPQGGVESRLHLEPFAVFDHPRFVRGQSENEWAVSAVQYRDGRAVPTIFPRGAFGLKEFQLQSAGSYPGRLHDARLVRVPEGFWLFLLTDDPKSEGNWTPRPLPGGRTHPGQLQALFLDRDLKATGNATALIPNVAVYEFDADAAGDEEVVVAATTAEGMLLARLRPRQGSPAPPQSWRITRVAAALVSPSVLRVGSTVHVAALALRDRGTQVLHARFDR